MPSQPIERDRIALGVQQPWADLIVRGLKTIEIRSTSTRLRGRIYIYASRRLSELPDAAIAATRFKLDIATLPRGVIVGTAQLVDSRTAVASDARPACIRAGLLVGRFAWRFASAERFDEPLAVRYLPYGIWFYPFGRKNGSR